MIKYVDTIPDKSDYKFEEYEGKNIPCVEVCTNFNIINLKEYV